MANVRTFQLPHYADYPVHVALIKNVTNAPFLRSQLLEANPAFDYAFLDATMVGAQLALPVTGVTGVTACHLSRRHALPSL